MDFNFQTFPFRLFLVSILLKKMEVCCKIIAVWYDPHGRMQSLIILRSLLPSGSIKLACLTHDFYQEQFLSLSASELALRAIRCLLYSSSKEKMIWWVRAV